MCAKLDNFLSDRSVGRFNNLPVFKDAFGLYIEGPGAQKIYLLNEAFTLESTIKQLTALNESLKSPADKLAYAVDQYLHARNTYGVSTSALTLNQALAEYNNSQKK